MNTVIRGEHIWRDTCAPPENANEAFERFYYPDTAIDSEHNLSVFEVRAGSLVFHHENNDLVLLFFIDCKVIVLCHLLSVTAVESLPPRQCWDPLTFRASSYLINVCTVRYILLSAAWKADLWSYCCSVLKEILLRWCIRLKSSCFGRFLSISWIFHSGLRSTQSTLPFFMASCTLKHAVSSKINDLSAKHLKYDFGRKEREKKRKEGSGAGCFCTK